MVDSWEEGIFKGTNLYAGSAEAGCGYECTLLKVVMGDDGRGVHGGDARGESECQK